jgi:hypothetical protein
MIKKNENLQLLKDLYMHVHGSIIDDSQKDRKQSNAHQ